MGAHYKSPFNGEAKPDRNPTIGLSRFAVLRLFRAGMDTMAIAEFHGITEAEVYNKLGLALQSAASGRL